MVNIFLIAILALITLGAAFFAIKYHNGMVATGAVLALILTIVVAILSCTSTVPSGHTGIITTFGAVEDRSLPNGLNFHAPWQTVTPMTNKEQKITKQGKCFTKDLQELDYIYTIRYNLLPEYTPTIYKTVGTDYYNIVIDNRVDNALKAEVGLVEAMEMTELRNTIQNEVDKTVADFAITYGIVTNFVLDDYDFSDDYTRAIEAKQVAEQEALRDKTQQAMETNRTREQADRTKIQAENDAAIRQINADADAQVARVKAQADYEVAQLEADAIAYRGQKEAEAIAAQAAAITDEIVAYEYAQRWEGTLPTYMMGSNGALPIIDIPMGEEKE